jgi:hypothetical protein
MDDSLMERFARLWKGKVFFPGTPIIDNTFLLSQIVVSLNGEADWDEQADDDLFYIQSEEGADHLAAVLRRDLVDRGYVYRLEVVGVGEVQFASRPDGHPKTWRPVQDERECDAPDELTAVMTVYCEVRESEGEPCS